MTPRHVQGPVLAIHATWRGFGWTVFEGPLAPVDWGCASARASRQARLIRRFERLLDRYEPSVVVFEAFEHPLTRRVDRIQRLYRGMIQLAAIRGAETPIYGRNAVRTVFASAGAKTRYEVAQVIALHIPVFRRRLPRARKPWMNESSSQSLFDAAALAITHFAACGQNELPPSP